MSLCRKIEEEMKKIMAITNELSPVIEILDFEKYKGEIQQIMYRIDEATIVFKVCCYLHLCDQVHLLK